MHLVGRWVIFVHKVSTLLHLLARKSEKITPNIYLIHGYPIYWQVPLADRFSYNENKKKEWMEVIRDAV